MKKEKILKIIKQILIFLLQIAFSKFQIRNIFPIGFPFAITRIFLGSNLMVVAFEYVVSNLFLMQNFYCLITVAFEIVVLSLYFFFKEMFVIKKKKLFLTLFMILATMTKVYYIFLDIVDWRLYLIETGLKVLILFFFLKVQELYKKKYIFMKCSNIDYLFFSVLLVLFLLGIFNYDFLANNLSLFIFSVLILLSCRVLPTDKFLLFSLVVLICFYYIFNSTKLIFISLLIICFLVSISKIYKYLFLSIMLFVYFVCLNATSKLNIEYGLSLLGSLIVIIVIPQKLINKFIDFFDENNTNIIVENMWTEKENEIKSKLFLMSKTLLKMKEDFRFLIVGKIDRKCAASELAKDIIENKCKKCENYLICSNSIIDKQKLIAEYLLYAIDNGEFDINGISIGFKTYCIKTIDLVADINWISKQYLMYEAKSKCEDESKLLVSSELENFAKLFENFAKNINKTKKINKNLSLLIKETLMNNMVEIGDIGVFENENGIEKIDIIADNNLILRKELTDSISKIIKNNIIVMGIKHLDFSGLSLVSFAISNDFKAEFAISASSKENISGDNCLISKLDESRFFVAIADGMGHGKIAGKTSKMILELIKNMFIVGIDLNNIIDCVNKLLLPVGLDNFSTLDAVIVDLKLANTTFVKLGSSVSAIKHNTETEIISCKSLPVGIIQNLKPTVQVKPIVDNDIIILASDGVVDCFGEIERYKTFINDSKIVNLQRFVDNVIFELNSREFKHKDDMSIIAIKLLKNN